MQSVYKKDDFFDSLSSNVHNNALQSQNGRTRYSEQIKIDTEVISIFHGYHIWWTMFNSFADLSCRRLAILQGTAVVEGAVALAAVDVVDAVEVVIMEEEEGMAILDEGGDVACRVALCRWKLMFIMVENKCLGSLPLKNSNYMKRLYFILVVPLLHVCFTE